jgi:hypothetical protein
MRAEEAGASRHQHASKRLPAHLASPGRGLPVERGSSGAIGEPGDPR